MMLIQAPFEVFAFKDIMDGRMRWMNWVPYYGVHLLTSLIPVFSHLLMAPHPGMDWMRTLLPKVADASGVLLVMAYAFQHGVFSRMFQPAPIVTPPTTPQGKAKVV